MCLVYVRRVAEDSNHSRLPLRTTGCPMATGYVWDERYAWHDAGRASLNPLVEAYPAFDLPETKRRIHSLVEFSGLAHELVRINARPATEAELLGVHTEAYLKRIRDLSEAGGGHAGETTAQFGPDGYDIACLAAGGCLEAVKAVLEHRVSNAYALVRPCGHHATANYGRGFAIFSNVAIAARAAKAQWKIDRIAVVDWDVHHGNGTQDIFYADPSVLTISLHQDRLYPPDTGGIEEVGEGRGKGYNINIPLPPGSGHGAYLAAMEQVVRPALYAFRPNLIFVACGLDAAINDPLGRMLCHSETYRAMTRILMTAASELCDRRIVACHEGGYSPTYAPYCGLAVIETLADMRSGVQDPRLGAYAKMGGQELLAHQREVIDRVANQAAPLLPGR
jgi:acetoin utilization deacetylase AcuC-like enzyme